MTSPSDITVVIGNDRYNLVPQTTPTEPIDIIKGKIANYYNTDEKRLIKVIGYKKEKKIKTINNEVLDDINVFTLEDKRTVIFHPRVTLFYVPKKTEDIEKTYKRFEMSESKKITDDVEETFRDYHVYVFVQSGLIIPVVPIESGGSRKNHRKSAKRVRISKKSSQTRVRKYRK